MKRKKGTNIIYATYDQLIKLGYKPQKLVKAGHLLCGTTKEQDLWIELRAENIKMIQKSLNYHVVLGKD